MKKCATSGQASPSNARAEHEYDAPSMDELARRAAALGPDDVDGGSEGEDFSRADLDADEEGYADDVDAGGPAGGS